MLGGRFLRASLLAALLGAGAAAAQAPSGPAPAPAAPPAQSPSTPEPGVGNSLLLYFDTGSARVGPHEEALLDQAAQLYREAEPAIMVLTGATDRAGTPERNLLLAQARAAAVLRGLAARGVPAERFLLVAKGEAQPAVPTPDGMSEPRNRRVEITWR